MNKITIYSRTSIIFFSILLTGFAGALMLGYNLRAVGKKKVVVPMVVTTLFGAYALRLIINRLLPGGLNELLISNVIVGLILAFPVWNTYLGEITSYNNKKPWIPLLFVVVLYGGLTLVIVINK